MIILSFKTYFKTNLSSRPWLIILFNIFIKVTENEPGTFILNQRFFFGFKVNY